MILYNIGMNRYQVTVKPGSSQEKVLATGDHELTVYLRAKPHDGEANVALLNTLAKFFAVSKTSITIVRGHKSRVKIIEL